MFSRKKESRVDFPVAAILSAFAGSLFVLLVLCSRGDAEQSIRQNQKLAANGLGIIDQVVNLDFDPITAFVIVEVSSARIRQYRAATTAFPLEGENPDSYGHTLLAAAPLECDGTQAPDKTYRYSFFFAGSDSQFFTTEVEEVTGRELIEHLKSPAELEQEAIALDSQIVGQKYAVAELEEKLAELRTRAYEIAIIDEIIALKAKIERIKQANSNKSEEVKRLQRLTELGRQLPDPDDVDKLRNELSVHLREAAQVTALADRLNARRQDAARHDFSKKLKLVKEMQSVDTKAMAQEVLRLRRQRRELENRLGLTSKDASSDEF